MARLACPFDSVGIKGTHKGIGRSRRPGWFGGSGVKGTTVTIDANWLVLARVLAPVGPAPAYHRGKWSFPSRERRLCSDRLKGDRFPTRFNRNGREGGTEKGGVL